MRSFFLFFSLLTSLFYRLQASPSSPSFLQKSPSLRMLERYAPKSGIVPLVLKNGSFFVHVDFEDHQKDASDSDVQDDDYGNMMPALYTTYTFFGNDCKGFQNYCAKYSFRCHDPFSIKVHFNFPFFESDGHGITSEVYLDYTHWSLKTSAMIGSSCNTEYSGGYGLLGMGFGGDSFNNFFHPPIFSVFINKNLKQGSLIFQKDLSYARSDEPAARITTDSNWHIYGVQTVSIAQRVINETLNVIFDLGSDYIGFPAEVYKEVLKGIEDSPFIGECQTGQDFSPVCEFAGDIRKLPSIHLNLAGNSIAIPPEVYVLRTHNTYFYNDPVKLRLKALSPNKENGAYVTQSHANYVILGYSMMSFFYTVFDGGHENIDPKLRVKPSISLYYSIEFESTEMYFWYLVAAALAGFLVIGLIYYLKNRKVKKSKGKKPLLKKKTRKSSKKRSQKKVPEMSDVPSEQTRKQISEEQTV